MSYAFAEEADSEFANALADGAHTGFKLEQDSVRVYGQNLFNGNFAKQQFTGFNPHYRIAVGDKIRLNIWGAIDNQLEQIVDPQGNIFISQVGPVNVAGTLNSELTEVIKHSLGRVYKKDVFLYANLIASQPVKVFVTGNVKLPGLYSGLSSESILTYLDRAGGIDPRRGSYLDIGIKRNGKIVDEIDLYDFLINGEISHRQLYEGDVIIVGSRKSVISFNGLVENPFQIEFASKKVSLADALPIVQPLVSATHIAIERNQGLIKQVEYIQIADAIEQKLMLYEGDTVTVVADKVQGSIGVNVEGEHQGQAQYILPYGAKLSDLMNLIHPSLLSNLSSLQLYRRSLAENQYETLLASLDILQAQVLGARSDTIEEANLRSQESKQLLQFIDRAKKVKPKGRVLLNGSSSSYDTVLQNGDTVFIPAITNLIQVSGEVVFPSAMIFNPKYSAKAYISQVGGFNQEAARSRIFLKKPNGLYLNLSSRSYFGSKSSYKIEAGDEVIVLTEVDAKKFQQAKDIFQIIYQLALSAGVVLSID